MRLVRRLVAGEAQVVGDPEDAAADPRLGAHAGRDPLLQPRAHGVDERIRELQQLPAVPRRPARPVRRRRRRPGRDRRPARERRLGLHRRPATRPRHPRPTTNRHPTGDATGRRTGKPDRRVLPYERGTSATSPLLRPCCATTPPSPCCPRRASSPAVRQWPSSSPPSPPTADGRLDLIQLVETRANGHPALAAYLPDDTGDCRGYGVMVLTTDGDHVTTIAGFPDSTLYSAFDLPTTR